MRLIDTHCHIDLDSFHEDRNQVLKRALEAGVSDMLVIGFEPERWKAAECLAASNENIRVAAGLHPNSALQFSDDIMNAIEEQLRRPEVVAIGETGLDQYWDDAPLDLQKTAFQAQIQLALELNVPFIVHQRDAESEVLEVLKGFGRRLNGVLHCFTGDWHYAQEVLELGMHIGLGGAITFKSRTALHEAAARLPLSRVVLETDAPFMAPVPHRGERNEPAYVRNVAERLAELKGISTECIAEVTTKNTTQLFPGLGERYES
jgi:TatD DNase family protein